MSFGIIGRTGPGMRQVWWGFGIGPQEGVLLGANLGRAIVTNGDFTAYVCDSTSTVGAAVWGGACAVGRGIAVLDGVRRTRGRVARFWEFVFPIFTMGNAIAWVANGEVFPIRMRKLDKTQRNAMRIQGSGVSLYAPSR